MVVSQADILSLDPDNILDMLFDSFEKLSRVFLAVKEWVFIKENEFQILDGLSKVLNHFKVAELVAR